MDGDQFSTMGSNPLLNEDPFRNEATQQLFEAIDELRSCGANHDIGIPELVIVGDQSAGKSSLLQSLTDIPFPVADRLCTRFPTRIVSRRTPERSEVTKISIEPSVLDWAGVFSSDENLEARGKRLEAYKDFAYSSPNITADGFKQAIDKAKELMDIKRPVSNEEGAPTVGSRNFASDVLKVEISGPNRSYFSILDVPGVFQSLTKGLTTGEKDGVRKMVASYMMPEHSVIICVASGTNDLANQATFDMASRYDPQLQRTVGVITKCDITQHKDQNQEKHLDHGWFVVRNRTPPEVASSISSVERHNREKAFFDLGPWYKLPEARRGTQALKRYLAEILCRRIKETFPSILATIRRRKAAIVDQLGRLGPSRDKLEEKTAYLTELAQQLYSLTSQALRGRYHGLSNESLKLRRFVREANDTFALKMINHGHIVRFHTTPVDRDETNEGSDDSGASTSSATPADVGPFGGFGGSHGSSIGKASGPLASQAAATHHFGNFFFEELRLSDYLQAQPSFANPSSGGSLFGGGRAGATSSTNTSSTFGNLGTAPESSFVFSAPAKSATNNSTNTSSPFAFGKPALAPTSSLVAATQASSAINNSTNTGGIAGDPTPAPKISFFPTTSAKSAATNGFASVFRPANNIYPWIREEIKNCRGTELQGTLNPDVLPALFHRQIAAWEAIATSHFSSVEELTTRILEQAVHTTCGDGITAERIKRLLQETNRVSGDHGRSLIHQRFNELLTRHLQTQNPVFERNIRYARLARFRAALERYQLKTSSSSQADTKHLGIIVDLRDITSLFDELHMSNAQNLEDDIHDTLKSYYELALHDFIEFVTQQVVESYLNDPKGPVLFFNPTYIGSLTPEAVNDLGVENPDIVKERVEKQATLTRLMRAGEIAHKYS
ncbi:MAG: hypothetical protein Q9184_007065 [Pyrenodesmia sp. 2 TL-2023]